MKSKTTMLLSYFVLALLAVTVLAGCRGNDVQLQKAFKDFSQILEQETMDALRLKIYYIHPSILTRAPLTVDDLIRGNLSRKVVVDSEQLKEHVDLLNQLNADSLVPVKHTSYLNARLCYIFETDDNGKVLEIAIGGENNNVFVNGVEVEYNDLFRNVVKPFLTEEVMVDLEYIFSGEYFIK